MTYNYLEYRIIPLFIFFYLILSSGNRAENIPIGFPSLFVKNEGQFNNESKYSLKSSLSNTFFFDQYLVHQYLAPKDKSDTVNPAILNIRIDFENSNPHPGFQEREPQTALANYFSGNDASKWKTDIQLFGALAYQNLYNKIDLVYYNSANSKKCDFVVHAGGNYEDILLKYSGVNGISINAQGVLQISSDVGEITENIPEAYQMINGNKIQVKAKFVVEDNLKVKFDVQEYNPAYDLIIDPQLIYSSLFGGTNDEFWPTNIVRDSKQNIYFGGRTTSSDFPTTPGAYSRTNAGDFDAFMMKLDPTGKKLIFSTYFGGTGQDLCSTIQLVGLAEDILIVGLASGGGFPTTAGAYQTVYGGYADDMFVMKLNNAGNTLIFSTLVGGPNDEQGGDFCLDKNGDIYVLGYAGYGFPTTTAAYQQTFSGDYDLVVYKLSADGKKLLYSTYIGGSSRDRHAGIALDEFSNVYITGTTLGDFPCTPGSFQKISGGDIDMVACKFDPTLSTLIFSTIIGGPGLDLTTSHLSLDRDNNLIFTGKAGVGFPTTLGAYDQTFNGGNTDCIIIKLKNDGSNLIYSSYLGSEGDDFSRDFTIDNSGNMVLTGSCGDGFPITKCTYDGTFNGGSTDCFISIFNLNSSSLIYSSYFGGSGNEEGINITASGDTLLVVGNTNSANLPVTANAYDQTYNGGPNDVFLIKFLPASGVKPFADFINPPDFCVNKPVNFINNSIYGTSYIWDFGDGSISLVSDPTHSFMFPGDFKVSLIVTNSCSSDTTLGSINVNGFLKTESVSICSNDSVLINGIFQHIQGNYDDTFPTASGCDSVIRTRLIVFPIIQISQNANICEDETYTVGTHQYLASGKYEDVLKSVSGCDSIVKTNLVVNQKESSLLNPVICEGEKYIVGTQVYIRGGVYSDNLKTMWGCDSIVTTNLVVNPVKQNTQNTTICEGEILTVGMHNYSLTGKYMDKFKTSLGCDSILTTNLTVNPIQRSSLNPVICDGESYSVGKHQYNYPGTYIDALKTIFGCDSIITTKLVVNYAKQIVQNPTICQGDEFNVGSHNYTINGEYSDSFKTNYGCDSIVKTNLTVQPLPVVSLGNDTFICPGNLILLDPGKGFVTYLWSDGSDSINLKVTQPGLYSVSIFDGLCFASDTIFIDQCGPELWFPNVFTPNNDGTNESFKPVAQGIIKSYHIIIFNRWGQQVYESGDANDGWHGTYNGNLCPEGVYYYVADYSTGLNPMSLKQQVKRGAVTILR